MSDIQNEQMAKDLHVIAAPFHFVEGILKIVVFLFLLPFVVIIGVVYSTYTGKPMMSPDECYMFSRILLMLNPAIVCICVSAYKHIRLSHIPLEPHYENHPYLWFILDIPALIGYMYLTKGDILDTTNPLYATSPGWFPVAVLTLGLIFMHYVTKPVVEAEKEAKGELPSPPEVFQNNFPKLQAEELDRLHNHTGEPDTCLFCHRSIWHDNMLGTIFLKTGNDLREYLSQHDSNCTSALEAQARFLKPSTSGSVN